MSEYAAPIGAPIWFELVSSDPARAAEFYHEIFDWELATPPQPKFGGYQNFTRNGKQVAGLAPHMPEAGPANMWSVYPCTPPTAMPLSPRPRRQGPA